MDPYRYELEEPIDRGDTLVRALKALVLALVLEVAGTVLIALSVFSHGWALVTQEPPPERVRRFSDRANALVYRIYRFLTYNEGGAPFPFDEFPEPIEDGRRKSEAIDPRVADELRTTEV